MSRHSGCSDVVGVLISHASEQRVADMWCTGVIAILRSRPVGSCGSVALLVRPKVMICFVNTPSRPSSKTPSARSAAAIPGFPGAVPAACRLSVVAKQSAEFYMQAV